MEVIHLDTPLRGRLTTATRQQNRRRGPDLRACAIAVANAINLNAGIRPEQVTFATIRTLHQAIMPMQKHLEN